VNELCESIARVAECVNQYNAHHYLVKNWIMYQFISYM
jgi:hypothetical protein